MPIPLIAQILSDGPGSIPYISWLPKAAVYGGILYLTRSYFSGTQNKSDRNMHSKVVIMTGATSGIGAEVAKELALRGAQLVILTQHSLTDPFLFDYIQELRNSTGNSLITAEQVDLADLYSIRKFATKWVDNAPPRRLDMIILCGNTTSSRRARPMDMPDNIDADSSNEKVAGAKGLADSSVPPTPSSASTSSPSPAVTAAAVTAQEVVNRTEDGLEVIWGVNYIAHFHLLSILSPAIRAQPPGRDVRVIFGTCSSYMGGQLPDFDAMEQNKQESKKAAKNDNKDKTPIRQLARKNLYGTSKLALMSFAHSFQKHLSTYERPDGHPNSTRVIMVDPGFTRTAGMTRYISGGSLWGLLVYIILYPLFLLLLKSPNQGAQTFLYACMEQGLESRAGSASTVDEDAVKAAAAAMGKKGTSSGVSPTSSPSSAATPDKPTSKSAPRRPQGGEDAILLKECRQVIISRSEVTDEHVQQGLWKATEETITMLELESAKIRANKSGKPGKTGKTTSQQSSQKS